MINIFSIASSQYFRTTKMIPHISKDTFLTEKNVLKYFSRQATASFSYQGIIQEFNLCVVSHVSITL